MIDANLNLMHLLDLLVHEDKEIYKDPEDFLHSQDKKDLQQAETELHKITDSHQSQMAVTVTPNEKEEKLN